MLPIQGNFGLQATLSRGKSALHDPGTEEVVLRPTPHWRMIYGISDYVNQVNFVETYLARSRQIKYGFLHSRNILFDGPEIVVFSGAYNSRNV